MSNACLLLLHIGRHKTGTTAIQQQLQRLQKPLLRRSILVPETGLHQQQHLLFPAALLPNHPALPEGEPPDLDRLLPNLQAEWQSSKAQCCLLSSEVFSELAFRRPDAAQELLQRLATITERLHILQVVRPLEAFILSAIKHQLRNDHLLQQSPLSWAAHCRRKQNALDHFWLHSGWPHHSAPYNTQTVVPDLLQRALREADQLHSWPRLRRRLQTDVETRPNADELPAALYAAQVIQIVQRRSQELTPIGLAALATQLGERLPPMPDGSLEELINLPQQDTAEGDWERVQQTRAWQVLRSIMAS